MQYFRSLGGTFNLLLSPVANFFADLKRFQVNLQTDRHKEKFKNIS